jgi:hypothetical protein
LIALCFCCLIFGQVEQINIIRALFQIPARSSREPKGSRSIFRPFNSLAAGSWLSQARNPSLRQFTRGAFPLFCHYHAGKRRIKNTSADQRRHEEERMGLSPMALNVAMAVIGISIPLLVFAGCIITRKKKVPSVPEAATHYEFDRAA